MQLSRHKVVIIGAGIAGITAGLELLDRGFLPADIVILEAEDAVGGRAKSVISSDGFLVNPGALWHHDRRGPYYRWLKARYGRHGKVEYQLAPQVGSKRFKNIYDLDDLAGNSAIFAEGRRQYDLRSSGYSRLRRQHLIHQHAHPGKDTTLAALASLDGSHDAWNYSRFKACNWMGLDHEEVSAAEYFKENGADGGLVVMGGTGRIPEQMIREFKARGGAVEMQTRVTVIGQTSGDVQVATSKGKLFVADQAIVTVPVALLKAGAIQFFPKPSNEVQGCLDRFVISQFGKVVVPLSQEFFEQRGIERNHQVDVFEQGPLVYCHAFSAGEPTISIKGGGKFGGSYFAGELENMSSWGRQRFITRILEAVPEFRGFERFLCGEPYVSNWTQSAGGAWSALRLGEVRPKGPIRDGRVVFAGEAFTKTEYGASMMHGAWRSGKDAGTDVATEADDLSDYDVPMREENLVGPWLMAYRRSRAQARLLH